MADTTLPVSGNAFHHPIEIFGRDITPPPRGKLKWLGGNLGLTTPVMEDAIDSDGNLLSLTLPEVLDRLGDFVGDRAPGMSMQQALVANSFSAYQYNLLSQAERTAFEVFVRNKLGTMPTIEVAKRLILSM